MRLTFLLIVCILFAVPCMGQVPIPLGWNASTTVSTPENPVNYRVYKCADETMIGCEVAEVGTDLSYDGFAQVHAEQAYYQVTAWNFEVESESSDNPGAIILDSIHESSPSNRLRVKVNAPPGNPNNVKIMSQTMAALRGPSVIDRAWVY